MSVSDFHVPRLLKSVLDGTAALTDVNLLVRVTHHLALTRLKHLLKSGRLHLQSFPMTLESAAIDCIADIFERDHEGRFVELADYFSQERSLDTMTSDQTIIAFRSLVFTKVYDGVFRLYENNDPILSKIIRNTKDALGKIEDIGLGERLGIVTICFGTTAEQNLEKPRLDIETLENILAREVQGIGQVREYLRALDNILRATNSFARIVPLVDFAVAVKRTIARHHEQQYTPGTADDTFMNGQMSSLIDTALSQSRKDLYDRYVRKGKLDEVAFNTFFEAIRNMVIDTFLLSNGSDLSNEEYLREQIPDLSARVYSEAYRTKFEYMARLAKKIVRERLKELL